MKRNIEDILSGESPHKDLENEPVEGTKKIGERILRILRWPESDKLSAEKKEALWSRIDETTEKLSRQHRRIRILQYGVAASVLIALSLWFLRPGQGNLSYDPLLHSAKNSENLIKQTEEISIQQGGGAPLWIVDDQQPIDLRTGDISQQERREKEPTFNTLTVPYGKRIEVILPDSSQVWLNAGSQLTFPTVFDNDERRVYLEGEGYFDVEGDAGRPFYVHTANMVVKVLGTSFNISSYKEDAFASTMLVSGEIELQGAGEMSFNPQILKPGTAAVLQKESKRLSISEETVENYISWTRKQLVLKNTPLVEVLARLERVYNTDITVESATLQANETFSGRLDLTQSLKSLLTTLYNPVEYQLEEEERRVLIRKK